MDAALTKSANLTARSITKPVTYVWTLQGWLYVAVVIDLFSRQVVGWAIDNHIPTGLKWLFGGENHHLDYFITRIVAANMPATNTEKHLAVMGMEQSTCALEGMRRKGNC